MNVGRHSCADPERREERGPDPPSPKNHKKLRFLSNTGTDPPKNHKAAKLAFKYSAIIGTPAKRLLNGV